MASVNLNYNLSPAIVNEIIDDLQTQMVVIESELDIEGPSDSVESIHQVHRLSNAVDECKRIIRELQDRNITLVDTNSRGQLERYKTKIANLRKRVIERQCLVYKDFPLWQLYELNNLSVDLVHIARNLRIAIPREFAHFEEVENTAPLPYINTISSLISLIQEHSERSDFLSSKLADELVASLVGSGDDGPDPVVKALRLVQRQSAPLIVVCSGWNLEGRAVLNERNETAFATIRKLQEVTEHCFRDMEQALFGDKKRRLLELLRAFAADTGIPRPRDLNEPMNRSWEQIRTLVQRYDLEAVLTRELRKIPLPAAGGAGAVAIRDEDVSARSYQNLLDVIRSLLTECDDILGQEEIIPAPRLDIRERTLVARPVAPAASGGGGGGAAAAAAASGDFREDLAEALRYHPSSPRFPDLTRLLAQEFVMPLPLVYPGLHCGAAVLASSVPNVTTAAAAAVAAAPTLAERLQSANVRYLTRIIEMIHPHLDASLPDEVKESCNRILHSQVASNVVDKLHYYIWFYSSNPSKNSMDDFGRHHRWDDLSVFNRACSNVIEDIRSGALSFPVA